MRGERRWSGSWEWPGGDVGVNVGVGGGEEEGEGGEGEDREREEMSSSRGRTSTLLLGGEEIWVVEGERDVCLRMTRSKHCCLRDRRMLVVGREEGKEENKTAFDSAHAGERETASSDRFFGQLAILGELDVDGDFLFC